MEVTEDGAGFAGTIYADRGVIGSWIINDSDGYLRSTQNGTYATYWYHTGSSQVQRYVTGYGFFVITGLGFKYIIKNTSNYDTGTTLATFSPDDLDRIDPTGSGGSGGSGGGSF